MKTLVGIELSKIFRKWRTYIGFIAIGLLAPIVQIAMFYEGENYLNIFTRNLQSTFYLSGNLMNGYLIAYFILQALIIHIPFLIVLVGGDILAGEATMGTYRMILTRPVSRIKVITSKFIAGLIYTNLLILWLAFLSLVVSIILFGTGELIIIKDKIIILASNDVLWRFIFAYGVATVSMSTVFALSFLFSALVENAIGPIVGAMAVIIIFIIISALPISALDPIKPYLFTNYMNVWNQFFNNPVDVGEAIKSIVILLAHTFGFYAFASIIFIRKDILS